MRYALLIACLAAALGAAAPRAPWPWLANAGAALLWLSGTCLLAVLGWSAYGYAQRGRYRDIAAELGLVLESGGLWRPDVVHGSLDGFAVSLQHPVPSKQLEPRDRLPESHHRLSGDQGCWLTVDGDGAIPRSLVIQRRPRLGRLPSRFPTLPSATAPVGDPAFDREFRVWGPEPERTAMLGAEVRRTLLDWITGGSADRDLPTEVIVRHGCVEALHPGLATADQARRLVGRLTALASALSVSTQGLEDRLRSNALADPSPDLRARSLRELDDFAGPSELARATSREALADDDPKVRFTAADIRGEECVPELWQLARDAAVAPELRVRVLDRLAAHGEPIETAVLALLSTDVGDATAGAVRLLGWDGSPEAVELLHRYARDRLRPSVASAARQALGAIRERLGDVDAGRLTLVESRTPGGELSLPVEGGGLTLAADVPARDDRALPAGEELGTDGG